MNHYEVAVAYRIYPNVSKVPPVFSNDKYRLADLCLRSFKSSLGSVKAKIWVLLDACPPEYHEMFLMYFDKDDIEFVHLEGVGNKATFDLQIKLMLDQQLSDVVYLAEDDYFYIPDQFHHMLDFLKADGVDMVTPYDHLDYYNHPLHDHQNVIRINNNHHWRTCGTTCLTFLTTKDVLAETSHMFRTYNHPHLDATMWVGLTKTKLRGVPLPAGYYRRNRRGLKKILQACLYYWQRRLLGKKMNLWAPIPSIATHMESDFLAPGVLWHEMFERSIKNAVVAEHGE